jgi:hypothetical protein
VFRTTINKTALFKIANETGHQSHSSRPARSQEWHRRIANSISKVPMNYFRLYATVPKVRTKEPSQEQITIMVTITFTITQHESAIVRPLMARYNHGASQETSAARNKGQNVQG